MPARLHRLSWFALVGLSLTALLTVLSGYGRPLPADEGTGAHIFQLACVLTVPAFLVFVTTADGEPPARTVRALLVPGIVLLLAFVALYHLEH